MIADLLAPVVLSTQARDVNGDLVPGGSAAMLTVTAPDGTVTVPVVTDDGSGTFTATLTADQKGTWLYRWVSPDPVALTVSAGQISVTDPNRILVAGLDEFKAQLDRSDYLDDSELRLYLEAATDQVEWLIGPLEPKTITERVYGWGMLTLNRYPVTGITSIAPVARGLPADFLAATDYVVNDRGEIRIFDDIAGREYEVVYQVGRLDIPADIKLAGLIIAQHLWQVQNGRWTVNAPTENELQMAPGSGFGVPWRAMELLRPYMSVMTIGGIA